MPVNTNIEIKKKMNRNKKINVLFFSRKCREEVWEYDFRLNELLTNNINIETHFLSFEEIQNLDQTFDVLVYSCRDPKEYEWGYMPSYEDVLNCVLKTKPKIIIQLSDEYKHENLEHHNDLAKYCNLMLRQHNHSEYRNSYFGTPISNYKNLIHMPLGYLNDTKICRSNIIPITERKYNWSFVGKIKDHQFYYYDFECSEWLPTTDRSKMVELFSSHIQNYFFAESGIDKNQLVSLYNDSIFGPCGRGNTSLNCFRNYEATICGAIPVVVSKFPEEFDIVFKFFEKPPWIFSNSWEDAIEKCNNLLKYPNRIEQIQIDNLKWWDNIMGNIQRRIMYELFKK